MRRHPDIGLVTVRQLGLGCVGSQVGRCWGWAGSWVGVGISWIVGWVGN